MSTIKISCRYSEMVPVSKLIENPRNPNRHPIAQIQLLAAVIKANGWRSPIVVSKRSGFIVKGHGRYEAAKLIADGPVPVEYQDYATEAEEWTDMIADNRTGELSEIDVASLNEAIANLKSLGGSIESAGFTEAAFEELRKRVNASHPGAVADASASEGTTSDISVEKLVLGKYSAEIPAPRANEWLRDIYEKFNNDENLVVAEIKRLIGL